MARIWRDSELTLDALEGKRVGVIGYGSQGRAQALNLRDSGADIVVGVRDGVSHDIAVSDGFAPVEIERAAASDVVALLLPDSAHAKVIEERIGPNLIDGASLVFAHGYTVHYRTATIRPGTNLLLVAPKAIGPRLRGLFVEGQGAAALIAAEPGDLEIAKAYAKALGCGRAAVIQSSFREETETDLFGEQAVLCGGVPALAMAAFDTLVDAGYSPEAAYFECLFEIKLIADLMVERGIAGMFASISDTAQYGAMSAGRRVVTDETRAALRDLLAEIRSGSFADRWRSEAAAGGPNVGAWLAELADDRLQEMHDVLAKKIRAQD